MPPPPNEAEGRHSNDLALDVNDDGNLSDESAGAAMPPGIMSGLDALVEDEPGTG